MTTRNQTSWDRVLLLQSGDLGPVVEGGVKEEDPEGFLPLPGVRFCLPLLGNGCWYDVQGLEVLGQLPSFFLT